MLADCFDVVRSSKVYRTLCCLRCPLWTRRHRSIGKRYRYLYPRPLYCRWAKESSSLLPSLLRLGSRADVGQGLGLMEPQMMFWSSLDDLPLPWVVLLLVKSFKLLAAANAKSASWDLVPSLEDVGDDDIPCKR